MGINIAVQRMSCHYEVRAGVDSILKYFQRSIQSLRIDFSSRKLFVRIGSKDAHAGKVFQSRRHSVLTQ